MERLLLEYLPILIFIAIAGVISGALVVIPFLIAPSKPDPEKLSAYECGFNALGDARRGTHSARALELYRDLGDLASQGGVLNNLGTMAYFEGRLRRIGVLRALEAEGFEPGDEVEIAGETFELDPS